MNGTVAAISTPRGRGGVAIIRISGGEAFSVAEKVFAPANAAAFAKRSRAHAYYGTFFDRSGVFDDGLCLLFNSPRSFTGEDVAELHCHGGVLCAQKLLSAVFAAGAEPAGPGEFTKRAFINGKLTLTQAEAIGSVIDAKSERSLGIAAKQAGGSLSRGIAEAADELTRLAASVYAFIDYPDEDMTDVSADDMRQRLCAIHDKLKKLADSHRYGKAISEGIETVITGKPNVGKSSVLNLLCGEERAIVTDIAGTTRDVVTETVRVGDYVLRLSDTAGIRESRDAVEKLGVERSIKALGRAELVLAVFDGSQPPDGDDERIISEINASGLSDRTVCVMNKRDIAAPAFKPPFALSAEVSALNGEGAKEIEKQISLLVGADSVGENDEIVLNARQYAAIERARCAVEDAINALSGFTQDVAGMDIERALEALYEADGRRVGEEIVAEIFSHFCVGK